MSHVRVYGAKETEADGHDEGGYFKMEKVPDISKKLRKRMARCVGCRNSFYNGRANITGNYCWSLGNYENFRKRGTPRCFIR